MPNERELEINTTHVPTETQRRGEAFLRALPIMLIPFFVAVTMGVLLRVMLPNVPDPEHVEPRGNPLVPILVTVIFFSALIALVRFGRPNLSSVIFIGVWTLFTTLFGLASGVNGIWAALLIVPICAAGLLLDGAASISLAALATLLMIALAFLETQGLVISRSVLPDVLIPYMPMLSAAFWSAIFWTIAALTYLLANNLQRSLKQSRAQATQLQEFSAQLEARVQQQTSKLLEQSRDAAVLEERARVARDIHDTLAQGLTGIVVQLGAAQRAMQFAREDGASAATADAHAQDAATEHLTLAQSMAREALAEARRSIWNLRAPNLARGELRDALAGLVERASNETMRASFALRGEEWKLRAEVESALLRVAQEALVNVGKHANATQVQVALEYLPDAIRLQIHDNGIGLDEEALNDEHQVKGPTSGFGLLGMRERLAQWGGELKLTNEEGANIVATIPRMRAERIEKTFEVGVGYNARDLEGFNAR